MESRMINVAIFNDTNTQTTNHYGCSLVMFNLVCKLKKYNLNPTFFWPVGEDWRKNKQLIKDRCKFSAIIVNGEGSIHHNTESDKANYLAEIACYAKSELKIPAYLINSTIYQNTPRLYDKLRDFEKIYVRESSTFNSLKDHRIEAEIVPDLTFASDIQGNKIIDEVNPYLITDSTFNNLRSSLQSLSDEIGWEYESMKVKNEHSFQTFLKRLQKSANKKNFKMFSRFFSFLPNISRYFHSKAKYFNKPYATDYKRIVDHDLFIHKIKSKKFVLTGRFHTVTLCIKTGTPFVAIESNTPKISSLLYDVFGSSNRLIHESELERFGSAFPSKYQKFNNVEIEAIQKYNSEALMKIDQMFETIAKHIEDVTKN